MKKRTFVLVAAGVLGLVGGGSAVAAPGPNGNNTYGLCNAYTRGSAQGQEMKRAHGKSFIALEAAAEAADQTVAEYCAANGTKPGGGE